MRKLLCLLVLLPGCLFSQIEVISNPQSDKSCFQLVADKTVSGIYFDKADYEVVRKSVDLFTSDVEMVTNRKPQIFASKSAFKEYVIIVGTLGKNKLINELAVNRKINVEPIRNQWESYMIRTVDNPFPGVKKALVIVGSDRRGTAFGVLSVSKAIGVSPWYWWADVPVRKSSQLGIKACNYVAKSPKVKYRGIFINDEDWGIFQWAKNTFDPDFKNIGPKTYAKVFELMLRLRLNYIWPAMHACTKEFALTPANITLADQWGIVAGSSHCEPMLCNNINWNKKVQGTWNYSLNRDTIYNYWQNSVKSRGSEEAVWTLGIRGIHDQGMEKPPVEVPDRINLVQQVFKDQRALLNQFASKKWGDVAQCFVPYKEVLPLYDAGLQVPEDVTIMWVDDNFGYIRRLGSPAERKRSGGAGVYWHLSYYGGPHSYLWLNTTAPALMWEELHKAWENDAGRIWVINVGDIKPMEITTDYFAEFAWNPEAMGPDSQPKFLKNFAAKQFGETIAQPIADLLGEYFRLGTNHKPEEMTRAWALSLPTDRAKQLRSDYSALLKSEERISAQLPVENRDAFFEMVGFQARVLAASGLIFMADREMLLVGDSIASKIEINSLRKFIDNQVSHFNNDIAGGKWKDMMPGMETAPNLTQWNSQVRWPWGEKQGGVSIPAAQPVRLWRDAATANRQSPNGKARWTSISGLGNTGKALALKPAGLSSTWKVGDETAPTLEYDFQTTGGKKDVLIEFLPTFRISTGMLLRVSVQIDEQSPLEVEVPGSNGKEDEYGPNRSTGIMNNFVQAKVQLNEITAGKHVLKIRAVDPGVVIDRISLPVN